MHVSAPSLVLGALLPTAALGILPDCGGSSGGGGSRAAVLEVEPNNAINQANQLVLGTPQKGDVEDPEDVDWFRVRLNAGRTVRIELFATRLDQAAWDAAANVPRLTVFFPDDASKVLEHSFTSGWAFGAHDFDIPIFEVPQNGNYWFVVQPDDDTLPGGRYALRVEYLNPSPAYTEVEEPLDLGVNDTPGTAQTFSSGLLAGFHRDANEDFYAINVPGPRVVRAELVSQRNGAYDGEDTYYDPLMRLYAKDGATVLAENDDAFFADPAVQHEVLGGGTYFLEVTQSPASTTDAPYFLRLSFDPSPAGTESEPNDVPANADSVAYGGGISAAIDVGEVDWFRFTGSRGDMVRVQVFDAENSESAGDLVVAGLYAADGVTPIPFDVGPEFQTLRTILQQNADVYVLVTPDPALAAPTTYRIEVRRFQSADYEAESNDTLASANPFPTNRLVAGAISVAGDVDLFRFTARDGEVVTFVCYADNGPTGSDGASEYSGHGSSLVPRLSIRDHTGAVAATSTSVPANAIFTESTGDGLPTAAVTWIGTPTTTEFYLEVAAADGTGSGAHTYTVERR